MASLNVRLDKNDLETAVLEAASRMLNQELPPGSEVIFQVKLNNGKVEDLSAEIETQIFQIPSTPDVELPPHTPREESNVTTRGS